MESINVLKGYGKVDTNLESQNPNHSLSRTTPKPKTLLAISAILFLTLVVSIILAALIHESTSESDDSPSLNSRTELIKTVCNVTRFPDSCFTSISSLHASVIKPDPESIFNLSLQVSVKEVKNVSSLLRSLNGGNSQAAIRDCITQFDDSLSLLDQSLSAMEVGSGEKALTLKKINDIQTWVSAAMTNQQTCLDGLEETGSMVLDEVKVKMENSKEFLSNNLAILANMHSLLEKFDLKMH